ncbi:hypothetical protein L8R98_08795 [Vibrio splendidus]|uniref:hypothetical protein n=1 Tax=Vibrio splendidus TaxID=29497 RepID=UPI00246828E0|nr:hypothetical protein [Vibrio splendidus]MDH5976873.1 hypothetical protein [Vibrio splendidus]
MSTTLTLKSIILEKINRIINPNFETKFIWLLFVSGLALIGYQRVVQLGSSIEILSSEWYVKLSLSSEADTFFVLIGFILVLIACGLFYLKHYHSSIEKVVTYKNLRKAASTIRPILDENRRIFMTFGPNSDSGNTGELRHDMALWEELKKTQIVPNNDKIRSVLDSVSEFDQSEQSVVSDIKSHIEAFKKHCENPEFDYSKNQFPQAFADLIFSYCSKKHNNFDKYSSWLRNETIDKKAKIESILLYGSAMYGEEKIDVDIIIKTSDTSIEQVKSFAIYVTELKSSFKKKFGLVLHVKVFSELEVKSYDEFMKKIHSTKKVI